MECPSCRADLPEGKRFCMECGAPTPVLCATCGSRNPPSAKFCGNCGTKLGGSAAPAASLAGSREARPSHPASSAERRQLTVMFCDLVGSTALASRLDPEDLREVIVAFYRCVTGTVGRFDGFIAKYMGDGVLSYFGWPQAGETDAERAVRASLALVDAVRQLPARGQQLQVRIGIATGLAVVGDLLGLGAAQEHTVVGEMPNLAARLQMLAEPGSVVIDAETRRQIGGLFDYRELGPVSLKGLSGPVRAWQVLDEAAVEGRFEAMHSAALTPLIGREDELDLLLRRWRQAQEGEGQVVLICGEPGIGKSRLIAALEQWVTGEGFIKFKYFCSPHHRDSALQPIIARWQNEVGLMPGEPAKARLDKLEALLLPLGTEPEEIALIAEMLGVAGSERYPPLALSPQQKKEHTFETLIRILAARARQSPILMLFEDAHWADPSSLELLDRLINRINFLPVLLIISYRSEFEAPWVGHTGVSLLALSRLSPRQAAALASQVVDRALPPKMLERIVAQTDGVPLFIEELTKAVLEAASQGDVTASALPVPSTLQASLMARLDRLPAAKQVAQIGAVIGREFGYELLTAVTELPEAALAQGLSDLVDAGLAFRRGTPPEATYSFKHALVQDAAYASLLRSTRQQLHSRIAKALEERFREVCEGQPELLAHHSTQAGLAEQAIPWWRRAAEHASLRSAHVEAAAHLSKGLELIATLPNTPHHAEVELKFLLEIGGPLIAIKGYAAPEVERTYQRARELCERLGRPGELFPALRGSWHCNLVRGQLPRAHDLAVQLVTLAEEQGEPLRRALAARALGSTLFFFGRFEEAAEELKRGIALDEAATGDRRAHTLLYADVPSVVCRLFLSFTQYFHGFPDRALPTLDEALAFSQALSHTPSLAFSLNFSAILRCWRRDFNAARRQAEAAIAVARKYNFPQWLALGMMCRGFALAHLERPQEGIAELHAGFASWHNTGARLFDTMWLGFTAEAYARAGEVDAAVAALDRAADTAAKQEETFYQAELHRLRGSVHSEHGESSEAQRWLSEAISVAQDQAARPLELRAATSLARLWLAEGRRCDARDVLAPIYNWFTEGFDTFDLREARALLNEIRG